MYPDHIIANMIIYLIFDKTKKKKRFSHSIKSSRIEKKNANGIIIDRNICVKDIRKKSHGEETGETTTEAAPLKCRPVRIQK